EDRETLKAVVSLAPDLSSPLSRFATKRHDGAHNLRDSLRIRPGDVANIARYCSSSMDRSSDGFKPLVPNGSEEIDLQIDTGQAFPFCKSRKMSYANRGIGKVTQDSTMNRSHGIRMQLGLSLHFH